MTPQWDDEMQLWRVDLAPPSKASALFDLRSDADEFCGDVESGKTPAQALEKNLRRRLRKAGVPVRGSCDA